MHDHSDPNHRKLRAADAARQIGWTLIREGTAAALVGNNLIAVEHPDPRYEQAALRDNRTPGRPGIGEIKTTRLGNGADRYLAVFRSPQPEIEGAVAAAEKDLAAAEEGLAKLGQCQGAKAIEELKTAVATLLEQGQFVEMGTKAEELKRNQLHMDRVRDRWVGEIRKAKEALAAARADLELFEKGVAHRYLRVEHDALQNSSSEAYAARLASERVRAVDSITAIDLTEWSQVVTPVHPAPFPIAWLSMVVPVELPDIEAWARDRYEPLENEAQHGLSATEIYRAFLAAHGLHASQCSQERFGGVFSGVFPKKKRPTGYFYLVQVKRTAEQIEADLLAAFKAQKDAAERAEFEAWKAARAAAGGAQ